MCAELLVSTLLANIQRIRNFQSFHTNYGNIHDLKGIIVSRTNRYFFFHSDSRNFSFASHKIPQSRTFSFPSINYIQWLHSGYSLLIFIIGRRSFCSQCWFWQYQLILERPIVMCRVPLINTMPEHLTSQCVWITNVGWVSIQWNLVVKLWHLLIILLS